MLRYIEILGLILLIIFFGSLVLSKVPVVNEVGVITDIGGTFILLPVGLFLFFFPRNIIIGSVLFIGAVILILSMGGSLL